MLAFASYDKIIRKWAQECIIATFKATKISPPNWRGLSSPVWGGGVLGGGGGGEGGQGEEVLGTHGGTHLGRT